MSLIPRQQQAVSESARVCGHDSPFVKMVPFYDCSDEKRVFVVRCFGWWNLETLGVVSAMRLNDVVAKEFFETFRFDFSSTRFWGEEVVWFD